MGENCKQGLIKFAIVVIALTFTTIAVFWMALNHQPSQISSKLNLEDQSLEFNMNFYEQ